MANSVASPMAVSARECSQLLIQTMPRLMRGVAGLLRQRGGEQPGSDNFGQYGVLAALAQRPRSIHDLATDHRVTASSMSRTIDVLVRRGWVSRTEDPADRRQVVLTLTEPGQSAVHSLRQLTEDGMAELLAGMGDEERGRLFDGLQALQTHLERTLGEVPTPAIDRCPSPGAALTKAGPQ